MTKDKPGEIMKSRIIDFTLSRWDKDEHVVYIGNCNGVYYGCMIKSPEISPEDIAKEIFDIDITPEVLNSRLTTFPRVLHDNEIVFYVSVVRIEVTYGMTP